MPQSTAVALTLVNIDLFIVSCAILSKGRSKGVTANLDRVYVLEILQGTGFEIRGSGWVREEESENVRVGVRSVDGVAEEDGDVGRDDGIG